MAEALLNQRGRGRFIADSAGSRPADRVNPLALEVLKDAGVEWRGHQPRGLKEVERESWDLVITVCDDAREACPYLPGLPAQAHWGMPDPAGVEGSEAQKRAAFSHALETISARIDLLLELPVERLDRPHLAAKVSAIRLPSH